MKHAAYCGTRNIYEDMETSAKSLVANSDVDVVHFFCEDDAWPNELPDIVQVHNVSDQQFFRANGPNMQSKFTYMAMMRIALCHVLPEVHMVLSLDADTICVQDVSGAWDMPIDDCYFSATHEWHRTKNGLMYCNAGVTLFNLEKMRDGKADECIHVLNVRKYPWLEQDVGNYLCQGRIHDMPSIYNSNWWTDKNAEGARIVHYAGIPRNDWVGNPIVVRWHDTSWDEVMYQHNKKLNQAVR